MFLFVFFWRSCETCTYDDGLSRDFINCKTVLNKNVQRQNKYWWNVG